MKKGFTLIELLAVIVILAIIALIATPIILNIIKSSKTSANVRSIENYAKAIENTVAKEMMKNNGNMDNIKGFYSTSDNRTITDGTNTYTIDYSGAVVSCDYIEVHSNGTVYLAGCEAGNTTNLTYGTKEGLSEYSKYTPEKDSSSNILTWDLSENGDGSVIAKLYDNSQFGGEAGKYTVVITGSGNMKTNPPGPFYNTGYKTDITKIEIEYGITSIDNYAFFNLTGLESVTIPNSVTSIGDYAIQGCTNLQSITIPNSVTSIGIAAFQGCTNLVQIDIPSSVISIGNYAFSDCTGLTSITIPNSVTSIGERMFSNCTRLENIIIPNSVTSIGLEAFYRCTGLTKIYYKGSLEIPSNKWGATNATIVTDF